MHRTAGPVLVSRRKGHVGLGDAAIKPLIFPKVPTEAYLKHAHDQGHYIIGRTGSGQQPTGQKSACGQTNRQKSG